MDERINMSKNKVFIKKTEDFVCEKCNALVKGDGYTNHCPTCLYSKHVDINPGDRASSCGGLMKPVSIEGSVGKYRVVHKCIVCGYEKPNKIAEIDDIKTIVSVINENSDKYSKGKRE
jgi:rubrerythrin